jgi:hypothetical protein
MIIGSSRDQIGDRCRLGNGNAFEQEGAMLATQAAANDASCVPGVPGVDPRGRDRYLVAAIAC